MKQFFIFFCFLFLITACSKDSAIDYRDEFIGEFEGIQSSYSHLINPSGPPFETDTTYTTYVTITKGICDSCLVIERTMASVYHDTIVMPANGKYIYDLYYDYQFEITISGDSIRIYQSHSSPSYQSSYHFNGKKTN